MKVLADRRAALNNPSKDYKRIQSRLLEKAAEHLTVIERRHIKVQRLLHALSQGLSQFFGDRSTTSKLDPRFRVGAVVRAKPDEPIYVYDPYDLLLDCKLDVAGGVAQAEAEMKEYSASASAISAAPGRPHEPFFVKEWYITVPDVCGLVLAADSVPFVGIVVESPNGLRSQDAVKEWIAAAGRIACERLHTGIFSYPDIASMAMRSYAMESVIGALQGLLNAVPNNRIKAAQVVEALSELSVQMEEGERPTGTLAIVQPDDLRTLAWQMEFPEDDRPRLEETMHVAKLFLLCKGSSALISDGVELFGLADLEERPENAIYGDFSNGRAIISFDSRAVAVVANNAFHAPFSPQEQILRDTLATLPNRVTEQCINALMSLVAQARRKGHGSTIVIHRKELPEKISGHVLKKPLPVCELTTRMCAVDGAVILDSSLSVRAFGCLLDGMISSEENRARGSRYNSAMRYTHFHPDAVVVVVSSDGPVSVFVNGEDKTVVPPLVSKPIDMSPPTLEQFVNQLR